MIKPNMMVHVWCTSKVTVEVSLSGGCSQIIFKFIIMFWVKELESLNLTPDKAGKAVFHD